MYISLCSPPHPSSNVPSSTFLAPFLLKVTYLDMLFILLLQRQLEKLTWINKQTLPILVVDRWHLACLTAMGVPLTCLVEGRVILRSNSFIIMNSAFLLHLDLHRYSKLRHNAEFMKLFSFNRHRILRCCDATYGAIFYLWNIKIDFSRENRNSIWKA